MNNPSWLQTPGLLWWIGTGVLALVIVLLIARSLLG